MRLENGQNVPMAHPNSSCPAGTVFHGRWSGKHRLRSRFRKAFFGLKETTDQKVKTDLDELRTDRRPEHHIILHPQFEVESSALKSLSLPRRVCLAG